MSSSITESPIRTGSFSEPDDVAAAIAELRRLGFHSSQIRVVTSDEAAAHRFAEYIDQQPAGTRTPSALSRATGVYLALAAIGLLVALFASLITTLIVATALLGVALFATFGSTMMTRGNERELSNYYAQGVIPGQILLAVELPAGVPHDRLAAADRVFEQFTGGHTPLDRE